MSETCREPTYPVQPTNCGAPSIAAAPNSRMPGRHVGRVRRSDRSCETAEVGEPTGIYALLDWRHGPVLLIAADHLLVVPRTRSSHDRAARVFANFGLKSGTRIITLLVSL